MSTSNPSLLQFPCRFPIKIMGANEGRFAEYATSLVAAHAGPLRAWDIESRCSRNGRFVSVTVYVHAESQAQLDAIYRDLSASSRVLMAL